MRGLAWMAITAAVSIVIGLFIAAWGALTEDGYLLAYGAVQVLAGVGTAMLSLRE